MMNGFFGIGIGWIVWLIIIVIIVKFIFLDIRQIITQFKSDSILWLCISNNADIGNRIYIRH